MQSEKLITRSFIFREDGQEHILEYYIFSEYGQGGESIYGLSIKQSGCDDADSECAVISENKDSVLNLIECFARNCVFPVSLADLLYDRGIYV